MPATHVVMTYCLSLYHMLAWHTACFCHIYCHAILVIGACHVIIWCLLIWHIISWHSAYVVTYYAMPYCLWKHNMLRHTASCSKISCYDIVCCCDIVPAVLWHVISHAMTYYFGIASSGCCDIPWYDALYFVVIISDLVPVVTYHVNMT
jgi:hypothetical protein